MAAPPLPARSAPCPCPLDNTPGLCLPSNVQAKYREAIEAAGADDPDALFGLAESLQGGAEATLAACASLPDVALTAAAAQQADAQAAAALQESVEAYQRVLEGGQPRVDALVCAGNALRCARVTAVPWGRTPSGFAAGPAQGAAWTPQQASVSCAPRPPAARSSWAEASARRDGAQAVQLLQRAAAAYRAALQQEEDALVGRLAPQGLEGLGRSAQPGPACEGSNDGVYSAAAHCLPCTHTHTHTPISLPCLPLHSRLH